MEGFYQQKLRSISILHVAPITHNKVSGLTFAIPSLVKALHFTGVLTGLLTTSPLGRYEKHEPYPVVYLRDLPIYAAIASMPEPLSKPDLIVFHATYILAHALLAYEAYRRRIPYVITPHGGMTRGAQQVKQIKKMIGNALFFNWMVSNAAGLHCLTEKEAVDVRKWNRPVFVVGNGVKLPSLESPIFAKETAELKFIFLGRLDIHHKGLDLLLEACAMIQEKLRIAKVQLHLYGPDVHGSRSIIKELINNYKVQDIVYLQEPVWEEEKQAIFHRADLFVHTSRFEGHPMAVLEALSYGVPCLLTPGTNMAEEVDAAGAGWAVEPYASAIANGICSVLATQAELSKRGIAARNLVEKYSWEQIGTRLLKEYVKIALHNR